jgi:hypothetical protein
LHTLAVRGVRGTTLLHTALGLWLLLWSSLQALRLVWRLSPACVVGMGGYVAGPAGLAAWLLRKPLLIHEQNAVAGTTNRLLAPLAPDVLGADAILLDELGQVLGSDHDLAVFIEALADEPLAWGGASVAVDLAHLADQRRRELTARALEVGRQLYVDPARVHRARMLAWWDQVHGA